MEKYFKIPSIQSHLANVLIHLPPHFWLLLLFVFNTKENHKKIHLKIMVIPEEQKKYIPHIPHSPRNEILWTLVHL